MKQPEVVTPNPLRSDFMSILITVTVSHFGICTLLLLEQSLLSGLEWT